MFFSSDSLRFSGDLLLVCGSLLFQEGMNAQKTDFAVKN